MVPSYLTTVFVDVPSKRPSALKEEREMQAITVGCGAVFIEEVTLCYCHSSCVPPIAKILCCLHSQLFSPQV